MYNELLNKCTKILESHGIPNLNVSVVSTLLPMTFTYGKDKIYIGLDAKFWDALGRWDMPGTIMHELLHILVKRYPPKPEHYAPFGTAKEWKGRQKWLRYYFPKNTDKYSTEYGSTHPEEDFVEAGTILLLGGEVPDTQILGVKMEAVNLWLDSIAQQIQDHPHSAKP